MLSYKKNDVFINIVLEDYYLFNFWISSNKCSNFDNVQDLKDTLLSEGRTGLTDFTVASDDDDEDL